MKSEELLLYAGLGVGAYFLLAKPLQTATQGLGEGIADIGYGTGNAFLGIGQGLSDIGISTGDLANNIGSNVGGVITDTRNAIGSGFQYVTDIVGNTSDRAVVPVIQNIGDTLNNLTKIPATTSGVISDITSIAGKTVTGIFNDANTAVTSGSSLKVSNVSNVASAAYSVLDSSLGGILPAGTPNSVVPAVVSATSNTINKVETVVQQAVNNVSRTVSSAPAVAKAAVTTAENKISQAVNTIAKTVVSAPTQVYNVAAPVVQKAVNVAKQVENKVSSVVNNVSNAIKRWTWW